MGIWEPVIEYLVDEVSGEEESGAPEGLFHLLVIVHKEEYLEEPLTREV